MIALPLLAVTLTLAPSGGRTSAEVWAAGQVMATGSDTETTPSQHVSALTGGGSAGVTFFLHRLVDDDAAPTLQAFLQRSGTLSVSGGGSSQTVSPVEPILSQSIAYGDVGLDADGYLGPGRTFYLGGSVHFYYLHEQAQLRLIDGQVGFQSIDDSRISIPLSLRLGGRFGNLRVNVAYTVMPVRFSSGDSQVPYWYDVAIQAYGVVHRNLELGASVEGLQEGGVGTLSATRWLARRFGIGLQAYGGHEKPIFASNLRDFGGGQVTFTAWVTPRVGLRASYQVDYSHLTGQFLATENNVSHIVNLAVLGRPW
jgi:hypothetical protein